MSRPSFGTGRRLGTALAVAATVAAATAVWLLLNYVMTRPRLRATLDFSRDARFTVSDATKAMIGELRAREQTLRIETYFLSPKDSRLRRVARIQDRVLTLTRDLLRRLAYFGGEAVEVTDHDVYRVITAQRAQEIGLEGGYENSLKLVLGPRERKLDLLTDLADIEIPDPNAKQPGRLTVPVLRDYAGEEAIASALRSLLQEKDLVAYWLAGHLEADLRDVSGSGVSRFARELRSQGFRNKRLDLSSAPGIPKDCSVLIICGPEAEIPRRESETILAWLRHGGRALMTPHIVVDERAGEQADFGYLLQGLGVSLGRKWVFNGVADPGDPESFRFGSPECARVVVRGGLAATHPVTRRIRQQGGFVELHRARAMRVGKLPEGVTADWPLLSTNPKGWEVEVPQSGERPSLARPKRTAPLHTGVSLTFAPAAEGGRRGRFVIVAGMAFRNGADPLLGPYGGRLIETNRTFATYLVNWLVREESLVTVAAPRHRARTMNVDLPQIERCKTVLVWIVPGLFLFVSFFLVFWRRRA